MKSLMLWIKVAVVLLALVVGSWFALENDAVVPVFLLGLELPVWRLGIWLLLSVLMGVLLGFALSTWAIWRLRLRLLSRERQLSYCERELEKMRIRAQRD